MQENLKKKHDIEFWKNKIIHIFFFFCIQKQFKEKKTKIVTTNIFQNKNKSRKILKNKI